MPQGLGFRRGKFGFWVRFFLDTAVILEKPAHRFLSSADAVRYSVSNVNGFPAKTARSEPVAVGKKQRLYAIDPRQIFFRQHHQYLPAFIAETTTINHKTRNKRNAVYGVFRLIF